MKPHIVTLPAVHVVGLCITTSPQSPLIAALWPQFIPRMHEIRHCAAMNVSYGVMDNMSMANNTFDYLAGNPVTTIDHIPAGMCAWTIPGGLYAHFDCTLATIPQTFDYVYNTWFPTTAYRLAAGPCYEYYGEEFTQTPTGKLTIGVPIVSGAGTATEA